MEKIFTAKTFDEAKALAVEEFGVDELSIDFEVIEQPTKKLFGGSKGEFRVRAIYSQSQTAASSAPASPASSASSASSATSVSSASSPVTQQRVQSPQSQQPKQPRQSQAEVSKKSVVGLEKGEVVDQAKFSNIINYVDGIFKNLGLKDYQLTVRKTGDGHILDITGENLGVIIGRHGETLDALQYLAILANNRSADDDAGRQPRLLVDCNGYREKRAGTLSALATRTAHKVLKQGRRITLEPMNPYERRVIHSKVAEIDGVFSNSIGDEPYRKVVISAEIVKRRPHGERERERGGNNRGERNGYNDRNNDRNNSGERNYRRDNRDSEVLVKHVPGAVSNAVQSKSYKKSAGFSTSFERDYKRSTTPAPEISQETFDMEKSANLYGKIEL